MADDPNNPQPPSVVNLPVQDKELGKLLQNVRWLQANHEVVAEAQRMSAKLRYEKFQALKAAGFSPAEALELCKGDSFV